MGMVGIPIFTSIWGAGNPFIPYTIIQNLSIVFIRHQRKDAYGDSFREYEVLEHSNDLSSQISNVFSGSCLAAAALQHVIQTEQQIQSIHCQQDYKNEHQTPERKLTSERMSGRSSSENNVGINDFGKEGYDIHFVYSISVQTVITFHLHLWFINLGVH